MHRQQFAWVVAVEGDQVCNLLALRLGHFEALTLLDFEADVASRGQRDWLAGREDGRGFAHAAILEVLGAKIAAEQPPESTRALLHRARRHCIAAHRAVDEV